MDEKILIKSERYNINKFLSILFKLGIIASIIFSFVAIVEEFSYCIEYRENPILDTIGHYFRLDFPIALIIIVSTLVVIGIIYMWLRSYELTVTNKRVFGKVAFGKRVDLPVDSVSAIGTISLMKGVSVSTASGKIKFIFIKNSQKIYDVLNNLLIVRQQDKQIASHQGNTMVSSNTDELKKFKELLDSDIITQEEFDKKKEQLLGL